MMKRKNKRRWVALLSLTCLFSHHVYSQTVYNTQRILEQQDNACVNSNMTFCQAISLGKTVVRKGKNTIIEASCPSHHPYLVGWDATRNEHIVAGIRPRSLTSNNMQIVVDNRADKTGFIEVFVGCATERLTQKGNQTILQILDAVPTNTEAVNQ